MSAVCLSAVCLSVLRSVADLPSRVSRQPNCWAAVFTASSTVARSTAKYALHPLLHGSAQRVADSYKRRIRRHGNITHRAFSPNGTNCVGVRQHTSNFSNRTDRKEVLRLHVS